MINFILEPIVFVPIIIAVITIISISTSHINKKSLSSLGAMIGFFIGLILVVVDFIFLGGLISFCSSIILFPIIFLLSQLKVPFISSGESSMFQAAVLGSLLIVELFSLLGFIIGKNKLKKLSATESI